MTNQIYVISDASKLLNVEPHVLRNWEYELKLNIPRNEHGHRYYTEEIMKKLFMIKKLKEHNFTLKYIRILLPTIHRLDSLSSEELFRLKNKLCADFPMPSSNEDTPVSPTQFQKQNYQEQALQNQPHFTNQSGECSDIHNISNIKKKSEIFIQKLPSDTSKESLSVTKNELLISTIKESITDTLNEQIQSVIENNIRYQLESILTSLFTEMYTEFTQKFTPSLTTNVAKEMNYHLIQHECNEEKHFSRLEEIILCPRRLRKKRFFSKRVAK